MTFGLDWSTRQLCTEIPFARMASSTSAADVPGAKPLTSTTCGPAIPLIVIPPAGREACWRPPPLAAAPLNCISPRAAPLLFLLGTMLTCALAAFGFVENSASARPCALRAARVSARGPVGGAVALRSLLRAARLLGLDANVEELCLCGIIALRQTLSSCDCHEVAEGGEERTLFTPARFARVPPGLFTFLAPVARFLPNILSAASWTFLRSRPDHHWQVREAVARRRRVRMKLTLSDDLLQVNCRLLDLLFLRHSQGMMQQILMALRLRVGGQAVEIGKVGRGLYYRSRLYWLDGS